MGVPGRGLGFSPLSLPTLAKLELRKTGRRPRPSTPTLTPIGSWFLSILRPRL